jgi:hypothetical protein
MNGRSGMVSPSRKCNWKNQKLFGLATGDQWKKEPKKKLIFLELKKDIVKKKKVNFLLDILNQNFVLFNLKKKLAL